MQRQRGGLIPIAEAFSDLPGPVQVIRDDSPQAQRGFTVADQVDRLVSASEADPDRGFMARTMALCSLPRSNPGNRLQYKRVNGPYTLIMTATGNYKLPYGKPAATTHGLDLDRSDDNPKPDFSSGGFALRLHANPGGLQQQRRKVHPAPQPDAAALQRPCPVDLQRRVGVPTVTVQNRTLRAVLRTP